LPVYRGEVSGGSPLISVREQAKKMGVNHNTIARAYSELEREGFIETRRGMSSVITHNAQLIEKQRQQHIASITNNFVREIKQLKVDAPELERLLDDIKSTFK